MDVIGKVIPKFGGSVKTLLYSKIARRCKGTGDIRRAITMDRPGCRIPTALNGRSPLANSSLFADVDLLARPNEAYDDARLGIALQSR